MNMLMYSIHAMDPLEEVSYSKLLKHRKACVSNSLSGTAFLQSSGGVQAHQDQEEAVKV